MNQVEKNLSLKSIKLHFYKGEKMGQPSSKYTHNGGIGIKLETPSCFSGEEVIGMVYISLKAPMAPATLYLIFKGKEETH